MTGDAETHVEIHVALGNGLVSNVAVARRALNGRANVRGVLELDVRLRNVAVDALPGQIQTLLLHRRELLDDGLVGRDRRVTAKTRIDAGESGDRTHAHALVTDLGALQ